MNEVIKRMSQDDMEFVRRMIEASRSGTGFLNDLDHRVDDLSGIDAPILVMHSLFDRAVPPENAKRIAAKSRACELFEIHSDSHLIWIGEFADAVWRRRLSFLKSEPASVK